MAKPTTPSTTEPAATAADIASLTIPEAGPALGEHPTTTRIPVVGDAVAFCFLGPDGLMTRRPAKIVDALGAADPLAAVDLDVAFLPEDGAGANTTRRKVPRAGDLRQPEHARWVW